MLILNDDFRLLHGEKVKEGGLARNEAILQWLKAHKNITEIKLDKSRINNALTTLKTLNKSNNETLYLFYPTVGIPVLKNGILGSLCSEVFFYFLQRACKKNRIIIDICDLKYEQSKDLKINLERIKAIKTTEAKLFESPCEFVFASQSMMEYATKKYHLSVQKCHVLDNGGNLEFTRIDFPRTAGKVKLVYAGTLNKGRCIDAMIKSMKGISNAVLYLCGTGGDWIQEEDNIKYLGPLDESSAHYIVSQCDMGLIPYDNTRMYYNIAYPTKLAFYLTAGIPFISTNVKEVTKIYEMYNIGYLAEISTWSNLFESITFQEIENQKEKIKTISKEFTWDYKCSNSILMEL